MLTLEPVDTCSGRTCKAPLSLRVPARVALALAVFVVGSSTALAQRHITALGTPVTENFDALDATDPNVVWTDNVTLAGWYSTEARYGASDGSGNVGGIYSFGTGSDAERALGSIASSGTNTIIDAIRLVNDAGSAIGALDISFVGEQWRNGGNASAQTLSFQYQVANAGFITDANVPSSGWLSFTALDFTSPITGAVATALDGNASANRTSKSATLSVTVNPGQEIWLRWRDPDDAGNDHGLAVDDLSVTATGASTATPTSSPTVTSTATATPTSDGSTPTQTSTATESATPTPTGSGTAAPTDTPSATAKATSTVTPTATVGGPCAADLFVSEYVEGSGNNRAVELYNGSGSPVSLNDGSYVVQLFSNGSSTPSVTISLSGTVANDSAFVLANSQAAQALLDLANQVNGGLSFTGNDAVVLRKGGSSGTILDVIGQIGNDPGSAGWGTDPTNTTDNTLRRKPDVTAGDPDGSDSFDPVVQWDGFASDTFSGLGVHVVNCGPTSTPTMTVTGTPPSATPTRSQTITRTPTITPTSQATITIAQIQGSGTMSPFAGQIVTTTGVVTARKSNGFFIQMPDPGDGDPSTSDGVLVFTSTTPPSSAAVGNRVQVRGTVSEFRPSADLASPPETEIVSPTVTQLGTSPLPSPVTLTAADTDPNGPIEQLERYEGMRVHVDQLSVVGPTGASITESSATAVSDGVFFGVIPGIARPFREAGIEAPEPIPPPTTPAPCCVPRFDGNPERLRVDSNGQTGTIAINVTTGATVSNFTGVLDYGFRTYTILPDPSPVPGVTGNRSFTPVPTPSADELTVGAFNLERFFDNVDDPNTGEPVLTTTAFNNRLNKASLAIRNVLHTPDVLGVEEVENLSTLQTLANKISSDAIGAGQTDPQYQARLLEGNDVGGIDVGFLVKSSVSILNITQENKTETYVNPNNGQSELLNDRPPLRLNASVPIPGGGTYFFTVIVVHQRSLGGVSSDVLDPNDLTGRRVRAKRRAQAESLARLVQARQAADPNEQILVEGDYNAFQVNDGYVDVLGTVRGQPADPNSVVDSSPDLVSPDLTDLVDLVSPADQKYSYSFGGNAQVLDHIVVTQSLLPRISQMHHARLDADFAEVDYADPSRPERLSDHDPPVAYILLSATVTPTRTGTVTPTATATSTVPPGASPTRTATNGTPAATATRTATPPAGSTTTPPATPTAPLLRLSGPGSAGRLTLALGLAALAAVLLRTRRSGAPRLG
jgi:uncharacterized protein